MMSFVLYRSKQINRHHTKFLWVERKGREWKWEGVQGDFNLTGEKKSQRLKQNQVASNSFCPGQCPIQVYPVKGQCSISSNLNRLHLLHHQYSSQHPMGHFVADRNFPSFSPSKDQNTISWLPWLLAVLRILSIIVWDPDTQTSLVFPFLFRLCLLLWRPHHIQKLVCSALVFRALENSLWAI